MPSKGNYFIVYAIIDMAISSPSYITNINTPKSYTIYLQIRIKVTE